MGCAAGHGLKETAVDKKKKKAWALTAPATTAAFLWLLSGCSDVDPLEPTIEYATEVKLGSPETDLKRDLRSGVYVVEIRERDIDVKAHVIGPASHVTLADDVPRHGLLATVVRLNHPDTIRLRLENADDPTKTGVARIRLLRLPVLPKTDPHELELAYAAFGAAGEQTAVGNAPGRALAVGLLHEAIAHFASAGDVPAVAQSQYTLANLEYLKRNEWQAAIDAAEEARKSFELIRDAEGLNNALTIRAANEQEIAAAMDAVEEPRREKLFASADQTLKATARFFHDHDLSIREAYALNMRGVNFYQQGKYTEAAVVIAQSSALAHTNQDLTEELKGRSNVAAIRFSGGHVAEASREFEAVLALMNSERHPYLFAANKLNYGYCLGELGEFDRAIAEFTEATDRFTRLGQKDERAVALAALGRTYLQVGSAERALSTLLTAADEERRVGDLQAAAATMLGAGNAASLLGRHSEALRLLRESLASRVGEGNRSEIRIRIAGELRATGDFREAEDQLAKAFVGASDWTRSYALEERGSLRFVEGNVRAAITDLRSADKQFADLGLEFNRINTQARLSQALLRIGDVEGAANSADKAIEIERRIRERSANPEWRARFLSARYAPYEARIEAHLAAHDTDAELRAWRGFQVAEEVRARSLADHLSRSAAVGVQARDAVGEEMRGRLTALNSRLEKSLRDSGSNTVTSLDLRNQIVETRAQLDKHLNDVDAVTAHDPMRLDSLARVQQAMPPSTAILAFFAGKDSTHIWLLTHEHLRHSTGPGGMELEQRVHEFISDLQTSNGQARRSNFARSLLGGMLDKISATRLLVLADGPLNGLPFAALPISGSKAGELLVDRFVIATAPSLQLAMHHHNTPPNSRVAIISDPVFTKQDLRLAENQIATNGNLRGSESLARLPYSAVEARAVRSTFGAADTIDLAGFEATAQRVLALKSLPLHVLHFATHAETRSDSPELSALYLSRYDTDGSDLAKDRLTADDIIGSGLRADLVVLSGCATGSGDELRGEGVLGLAYGFLANGSNSVVASLWQIEDAPTAQFMEKFYAAYRETGRAADALRSAQLDARRTGSSGWSSFVVRANAFP